MDDDPDFSELSVTARERALQEKIIRLEKKLEGYQTQIDIIDSQRQQLEERAIRMESALAKAKNGLLKARKELMDKEIAEKELAEKLNSMTQQAEEYKNLFITERNKNKYSIETLEALLSTVEAEIAPRKEFHGFLNEVLTEVKEGFYAQLKVVFDKLKGAESMFHRSPQKINQCKTILTTSCSATQFGICGKGKLSTGTSSSPTPNGVFGTAAETTATSTSQIPFGKIGTASITSATGNAPTQYGLISTGAIITTTSSSPTQYGMSGIGAITKVTTSWPTQYGMIGTAATTRATSSSLAQHGMFGTAETTTVTSSSPSQYGMISRAVTTTFPAMPPIQSSQTQVPFKQCQKMIIRDNLREQETKAIGTSKESSDLMAKSAPKPGSSTCPVCLVSNEEHTTGCVTCGAAKLSDGTTTALQVPKTGFHLLNQTMTSSAPKTVSGISRGNTSSASPFTFGNSDVGSVNIRPFKSGVRNTGPVNSLKFKFGISDSGPRNSSPFSFGSNHSGPVNSSPFTFAKSDTGTTKTSIFAFAKTDAATVSTSPFTFSAPPSAPDDTCTSQKATVTASQVVGGSTKLPQTSKPPKPQPFILPASGVPATANKTTKTTFAFGSSGSPSPVLIPEKAVSEATASNISEGFEGQDEDKIHFEPVIPLPDEIKVVTGKDGLEVLFSERAKLYRFDADSGKWKERGVGDVKLLRHPKSGQGRVLMRRDQIKKLCANHNINSGMELKPNVGSDRSWVWYTPADYAEGEARPEKLAIKLESAEIAGKFREVFEDLKEASSSGMPLEVEPTDDQQGAGCALYKQFISTFATSSDVWTCEMCYVENSTQDLKCIACNSAKPGSLDLLSKTAGEDRKVSLTSTNTSVVEFAEPSTFQDFNKDSTSGGSIFPSPGVKGLTSSQLFTIGRGESSEDKLHEEIYLSPSKSSSPSKQGVFPQTPSTPLFQENIVTSLPFGTNTPAKFTFSLQVSRESPARKPKSPMPPSSPLSSWSPGHAEDDGPHFEPVIPLPEKVECRTGEEGQEVMFCERCKLFRYDSDASQWKERGVGDIKILRNPSSRRYRVLMRREHVLKLCANHMISVNMELKPFPNSDRAWLWTTLADFSDEVAATETLGARFKTRQIAAEFKDTFEKAWQSLKYEAENIQSSGKPDVKETDQETGKKRENDISVVFERRVTDNQKQRAKRLELPCNCYVFEDSSSGTDSRESEPAASEQSKPTADVAEEISTPSKLNFLFGSSSVA